MIFSFEASDRRKLLGVVFQADLISVFGCPDSKQARSSTDRHGQVISSASLQTARGKETDGPSTSPGVSVQTHLGHARQTHPGETVKRNRSESPLLRPLQFCGIIHLSQLCRNPGAGYEKLYFSPCLSRPMSAHNV